eukprot:7857580-Pyramimonas_sp.AAC.1
MDEDAPGYTSRGREPKFARIRPPRENNAAAATASPEARLEPPLSGRLDELSKALERARQAIG